MTRRIVFEDDDHHRHVRAEIVAPEAPAQEGVCWFDFCYEGPENAQDGPFGPATVYYLSIQPCGPWWFQQVGDNYGFLDKQGAKTSLRAYFNEFSACRHEWSALKPTRERKCARCNSSMTAYWPKFGCVGMPIDVKMLGLVLAGEPHRNT